MEHRLERSVMGIYLNPGKYSYEEAVASEVFVDKSEMILHLNAVVRTKAKYVSVSRPRRIGKTMAADMLCAYYGRGADARSLFEQRKLCHAEPVSPIGKEIAWDAYLGAFDVVRVVMTDFFTEDGSVESALEYLTEEVADELMGAYPDVRYGSRLSLRTVMGKIHAATGRQFAIVIDEWDAPFRIRKADARGQRTYLDFLRDWLKDKDYVALAYMTGILPIKKYGRHSALNMFEEYSMVQPQRLAEYVGFTADEVRDVCAQRGLRFEGMREWYDGYRLSNKPSEDLVEEDGGGGAQVFEVYNPYSVVRAARGRKLGSYWSQTETYEALAEYIRMDYDGLRGAVALLMDGGRVPVDTSTYQNEMTTFGSRDDVLSLLVHLGYLGYDEEVREAFVPNREVMDEFRASTKTSEWALGVSL